MQLKNQFRLYVATCVSLAVFTTIGYCDFVNFGSDKDQFSIEFVTVANPGSAPDTKGDTWSTPLGAVPYTFQIGKFEVSREMIDKANAASLHDTTGGSLGIDLTVLQWIGDDEHTHLKPATGLSWNTAARFVNWLNTSSGFPPAYRFATEPSDAAYEVNEDVLLWETSDPGYNPDNPMRNSLARFVIPSLDEWYKAAYHDASAGVSGSYFDYATGSDTPPLPVASGTAAGTAVYLQSFPAPIHLAGGQSRYGTVAQSGNGREAQESYPRAEFGSVWHRGGGWGGNNAPGAELAISSLSRWGTSPRSRDRSFGLRVAMVPDLREYSLFGDINGDEIISPSDLDLLSGQVRLGIATDEFDLNEDGVVDDSDRALWIERAALTVPGDANLNRRVDFDDFLKLSHHFGEAGTWGTGDFDGNGHVNFPDFLLLSENYQSVGLAMAVPEPRLQVFLIVFMLIATQCRVRELHVQMIAKTAMAADES